MDTLAHGLWGGAAFGQKEKGQWKWAFFLGMAPDLFSFGPFFLTRLGTITERWGRGRMEPPDPSIIPAYVYHAYNVTHSLVVWAVVVAILWKLRHKFPWVMGAWALHILCDMPTHTTQFFPTPFLWPFPTPFIDGIRWGSKTFMIANYSALAIAYLALWARNLRRSA